MKWIPTNCKAFFKFFGMGWMLQKNGSSAHYMWGETTLLMVLKCILKLLEVAIISLKHSCKYSSSMYPHTYQWKNSLRTLISNVTLFNLIDAFLFCVCVGSDINTNSISKNKPSPTTTPPCTPSEIH